MTNSRKARGRATEHLVARAFAADGWPHALPTGAGAPGRDITGLPGIAVEVKARAAFSPQAFLRQAMANAGQDLPLVVLRCNGAGPTTIDDWPVFTTFRRIRDLLRAAGYGDSPANPPPAVLEAQRAVANAAIAWVTAATSEEATVALNTVAHTADRLVNIALSEATR